MKNIKSYIAFFSVAAFAGALLPSCASEEPFANDGEGTMRMRMVINSDVTRAEIQNEDELRSNCVVYISGEKGLLHKYKGLENVPEKISLKLGSYVAEAWTGDSVSASYDKKFYRGYQPFEITAGANNVVVNCKIANVVASINHKNLGPENVKEYKVTIGNSRASLEFTEDNAETAKGYYMMPNGETSLTYVVEGVNLEGKAFKKEGVIDNVARAHEYVLNFECNPDYESVGGSFLTVTVDNSEILIEDEIEIFSRPVLSLLENDIDKQVVGNAGAFKTLYLKAAAFGGYKRLQLSSDRYAEIGLPAQTIDLMNLEESAETSVRATGISWDITTNTERNLHTAIVTLPAVWLNKIPESDAEYVINVLAEDTYGKVSEAAIRLAVGEGAIVIDDPVTVEAVDQKADMLAVASTRATLTGALISEDAANPGIKYRESGSLDWSFAPASDVNTLRNAKMRKAASKATFTVTLTGLKPGTRYEYKAAADGFESSDSHFFTTEGTFTIPNASFEDWSTYSAQTLLGKRTVILPWSVGDKEASFWGSGNEGAATANKTLTDKSTDMFHSGAYSARLASDAAMGIIAAGNIFIGSYVKTDGTNGVLSLGRSYDGSHPSALKVWANYRPASGVTIGQNADTSRLDDLAKDGLDQGQIYVALTTEPVEIRTNPKNLKVFDREDPVVLAYGQQTWKGNFGPDGALEEVTIPIEYKANAKTNKPLYLIVVVSASKFGDFFSGAKGSTFYLDDFSLVYE